jgi:purine-binding chemotaxis protein CheW
MLAVATNRGLRTGVANAPSSPQSDLRESEAWATIAAAAALARRWLVRSVGVTHPSSALGFSSFMHPSPLAAPPSSANRERFALLCRVRERLCALPLSQVVEIMRPLPVERLASMPGFVRGLARARGNPLPVVDLGTMLGAATAPRSTRFVMVRVEERRALLAVEEVMGVRDLGQIGASELPPLLGEGAESAIAAVGILDAALLVVLRGARLVPPSTWDLAMSGRGA